ncbi:hypothetical protein BCR32DRAFT_98918 [Anaeromyces robustus]|uniref:Dynactin subunit 2 n=1 Tax=Anaeromyces robustus TaxID=1754192 RepID=A0A1Y1WNK3_9FUNG|nr:hypothetical protein BCR32DRAFT_98918 [Anaeromyces robustus]|eukprot:ORX75052.1 hypothetical protein BCR32DRAFT_98918 [Anaeromyces robustus]
MSKYQELEGYDFNSSEVYETGGTDDNNEANKNLYSNTIDEQANESINHSTIEMGKAYKMFSDVEEKDASKQYEIDYLAGKIEKSKSQSLSEQLRRLIKEVNDLKFKIEQEKEQHPEFSIEDNDNLEANTEIKEEKQEVGGEGQTETETEIETETKTPGNITGPTTTSTSTTTTTAPISNTNKKINKTSPSYMLDQASKLQNELEKLTLGIVNDGGHGINAVENILIQQKMINQIKVCKINALKEQQQQQQQQQPPISEGNQEIQTEPNENMTTTTINNNEKDLSTIPQSMTTSDGITYKLYYSPQSIQYHHLARMSDLEERITQIEAILGINSITDDNILFPSNNQMSTLLYAKGNIVTAIDSLDQQLQLLSQPSNFDNILVKVNEAIKELEQFINIQKNKLTEESIDEQAQIKEKVDSLYTKLESTEEYSAIITPLLTRLKTLQALHTEASQFSESIQMFSEQQGSIKNQIKDLHDMMSNLSESLEVNKTIIENNIDSISKRIDQLMDRVKEL